MPVPRPEKVLEQYYQQLCEWAAVLTRGDRSRCEDLVHDFYLYIALTKPDFSRVESLDDYLYQSLRHLYLAAVSRASREAMQSVSGVDFDSIRFVLGFKPNADIVQNQNDLRLICNYAVWRKPQHRSASYLILKFFHGYRIQEVAEIARVTVGAVERRLSEARAEVRGYLEDRAKSKSSLRYLPPEPAQNWSPVSSQQLVRELRALILAGKTGECLSTQSLDAHYRSLNPRPVSTTVLSHIVSCEACLARIDGISRRPTLKDREPLDGIDGFGGGGSGESGAISGHHAMLRRVERLREAIYDHRPQALSIAIDGKIAASLEVRSQRSIFSARTERLDESTFVEVLSDQGMQLAMLWFDKLPPQGSHQRKQRTELSNDRWVDLTLTIDGQGLTAEVVYFAPELATASLPVALREEEDPEANPTLAQSDAPTENPIEPQLPPLNEQGEMAIPPEDAELKSRFGILWSRLCAWFNTHKPSMNPVLASATVLAVCSVFCFLMWWHQPPRISTNAFMVRAEKWDSTPQKSAKPGVIYQKVQIKTRKRTINRGIYRDAEGVRTLRHQDLAPEDALLRDKLAGADVDWNQPLSAGNYQDWHDHQRIREDSIDRAGSHLLALTTKVPSGPIVEQTLTVRDSDFHPVERTIRFRDDEQVEIAELSYDVLPWSAVDPNLFSPIVPAGGLSSLQSLPQPSLPLKVFAKPTEGQLDEAELSARLVLNQLHADGGEQIELVRDPSGIVVKGIVATEQRRQELNSRLSMLPHVTTMLSSLERMKREQALGTDGITGVKVASMQTQPTPLETYYLAQGRNVAALGKLSRQLVDSAFTIDVESRAIEDLQHRFVRRDGMSLVASAALSDLLFTHKHKLLTALDDEQQLLTQMQVETQHSEPGVPADDANHVLTDLAAQNLTLARELTLSNGSSSRPAGAIASHLAATINGLFHQAHAEQVAPQNFTSLGKRK